jgi:predicted thioesterase
LQHGGRDAISRGKHERFIINRQRFDASVEAKKPTRP